MQVIDNQAPIFGDLKLYRLFQHPACHSRTGEAFRCAACGRVNRDFSDVGLSGSLQPIGLAKENEFAQKIDQHGIADVVVSAHDFLVHRNNQEWIALPEAALGLQSAIVKEIDIGSGNIGTPFLALRVDVLD